MSTLQGKVSRRAFFRRAAAGGVALGIYCSGCSSRLPDLLPVAPTSPSEPEDSEPAGSKTTADPAQKFSLNRLVRARHAAVWQGSELLQAALRQMLDSSLAALTGLADAGSAWSALFKPGERVAIKVNAIISGASHVPLVMAITERLQDAGIAAEDIVIYDRRDDEMRHSGFPLNHGGSGVQCYGSNGRYGADTYPIMDARVRLSSILNEVDALINVPVLKGLTIGGISFAMKNHYGTLERPSQFHDRRFDGGVTGLNALEPLRARTR